MRQLTYYVAPGFLGQFLFLSGNYRCRGLEGSSFPDRLQINSLFLNPFIDDFTGFSINSYDKYAARTDRSDDSKISIRRPEIDHDDVVVREYINLTLS